MDLTGLIASFATGTYVVTRRAEGSYDANGRAVAGATTTLQIAASVQPASGQDLLRLPEGRRTNETRVVFTTILLRAGQGTVYMADLVTIEGQSWEVQQVGTWIDSGTGSTAYRCIVQSASP